MADLYTSNYPSSGYASESLMRSELQKIQEAFTKVMSTDPDDGGRVMSADLDLNLNNLLNVATVAAEAMTVEDTPVYDYILTGINEAVAQLLSSIQDALDQAEASANAAQASATSSEASNVSSEGHADDSQAHAMDAQAQASVAATYANQANAAATDAENSLNELQVIWMGTRTSHPTIADGADVGTLYYNSNNDAVYFCWATQVFGGEVVGLEWRPLSVDDETLGSSASYDVGTAPSELPTVSTVENMLETELGSGRYMRYETGNLYLATGQPFVDHGIYEITIQNGPASGGVMYLHYYGKDTSVSLVQTSGSTFTYYNFTVSAGYPYLVTTTYDTVTNGISTTSTQPFQPRVVALLD